MDHSARMKAADDKADPEFYFSYVLQFDDGTFYVGHTNAPAPRWMEHAVGRSQATANRGSFRVRMALPFISRREAQYNEERMQDALNAGPERLEALIRVFDQMVNVVRPHKTLRELEEEQRAYEDRMRGHFHHSTTNMMNLGGRPPTSCGYDGPKYYSTPDWDRLRQMQREKEALESVGGKFPGRPPCLDCLALAPDAREAACPL